MDFYFKGKLTALPFPKIDRYGWLLQAQPLYFVTVLIATGEARAKTSSSILLALRHSAGTGRIQPLAVEFAQLNVDP